MNSTINLNFTEALLINATVSAPSSRNYTLTQVILLGAIGAILSVITVVGNVMVMVSFKIDKQLQTISNWFLFSLAGADFAIGLISMPLYTVSTLLGHWPLGPFICDTWLALDYLASNASVLNLLMISFDRYFSVTRPLTYRVKRTNRRAWFMILGAWGISLLLWPPWIYSWPYIEGQRTVPDHECYIQFIETNHYITFGTAIAAFYIPVTVMCILYWRIWRETEKRQKDLPNLQAGKKDSSKRSNSSDEQTTVCSTVHKDFEDWRRSSCDQNYRHSYSTGREDSDIDDTQSEFVAGDTTPATIETPLQSSVSRCTSLNVIRDSYLPNYGQITPARHDGSGGADHNSRSLPSAMQQATRIRPAVSTDNVYTILIRLPSEHADARGGILDSRELQPSIKMIPESSFNVKTHNHQSNHLNYHDNTAMAPAQHFIRRPSHAPSTDSRLPLNTKIIPKQLADKQILGGKPAKKKKKTQEKKADKKAAKTLSAILLTFIITWLPYNILVLIKPLTSCGSTCISEELWDFFYFLCYINSTINPMCYALCNASFRRTYLRILTCKWHSRNRSAMNRGYYG